MEEIQQSNQKQKINIIGFSGKIGVGKNYLSENIIGKKLYELGYNIHFVGYGDFVKYEVGCRLYKSELIDDDFVSHMDSIYKDLFVNKKKETRRTLQLYGTEYSRQGGNIVLDKENGIVLINEPNVWVKAVHLHISNIISKSYNPSKDIFFITDLRFPNEYQFIKQLGGITIRINGINRNHQKLIQEAQKSNINISGQELDEFINKAKSHASEISLDDCEDFDFIIDNDIGNELNVQNEVESCINHILAYISN
jgi:hypothetical protein